MKATVSISSVSEKVHVLGENAFSLFVQRDQQSQSDRNFRSSHRHDKKDENASVKVRAGSRKGDQCDVDSVEHQFQGHQDKQNVAANDDAQKTHSEKKERQD
jgi:hypothetical protein